MYLLTECIARDISMRINDNPVQLIKHVIDQLNGISEQQRNELYTSALKALAAHKPLSMTAITMDFIFIQVANI